MKAALNVLGVLGQAVKASKLTGYAALRNRPATVGDVAELTTPPAAAGTFTATTTSALDNGGTVIASATPGVMWVRDGVYNTALAPM
ncbi:MAG: hypothetical protein EA406_03465, partial [Rhodospirillales bacterium]